MEFSLHLKIAGTGSHLPEEILPNEYFLGRELKIYDLEDRVIGTKVLENSDDIFGVTRIRERRKSKPCEFPSDLGYLAAVKAIEMSGLKADSLVGIILATVTEECNFPSGACKIQKKLGVRNCLAYDTANACAGFPEALCPANARVVR